ncbi:MAG: hypothetical protein R3C25_14660 [Hyphomonadaceae bacterium]
MEEKKIDLSERVFARRMARELEPSELDKVGGGGPWTGCDWGDEVSNPYMDWAPTC